MSKVDLDRENRWYRELERLLLNKKIIDVKWEEWDDTEDYSGTGITFITDNGIKFFLSQDDEGNGPGALHWTSKDDDGILPVGVMAYDELLKHSEAEREKNNDYALDNMTSDE